MTEEILYLSQYETALAVVATAMKKSRLRIDSLVLNSFIGGLVFSSGGMLHVMVQADCPQIYEQNPGLIHLLQGLVYPIGLFYVVILGMELFNANVFYFSAAWCRGAVSSLDLAINLFVSWWVNLVANIFVCYVICNYSDVTRSAQYVQGSIDIVMAKANASFVETLLKGIAGNFFVAIAIYLQLMCKPLHVKLIMMGLPVFSFVAMGFTHSVADMFMLTIGLINKAPVSVGTIAWKVFLPGAIGNLIGGAVFGVVITWYCHIYLVERDSEKLNLPKFELRDEQPDLNADSRVVRQRDTKEQDISDDSKSEGSIERFPKEIDNELSRSATRSSRFSRNQSVRSPKNVFPVYGMGQPLSREKTIASGRYNNEEYGSNDQYSAYSSGLSNLSENEEGEAPQAEFIGDQLKRVMTRQRVPHSPKPDLESQVSPSSRSIARRQSAGSATPRLLPRYSFNNSLSGAASTSMPPGGSRSMSSTNSLNLNHAKKNSIPDSNLQASRSPLQAETPGESTMNSSNSVVNYQPQQLEPDEDPLTERDHED